MTEDKEAKTAADGTSHEPTTKKKRTRPPGADQTKSWALFSARQEGDRHYPQKKPRKLTPEMTQRLCDLVRNGAALEHASHIVGLDPKTVKKWLKWGELESAEPGELHWEFRQFRLKVLEAENDMLVGLQSRLVNEALDPTNPQGSNSAKWLLSKRAPEVYGDKSRLEVSGEVRHEHYEGLSTNELMRRLRASEGEEPALEAEIGAIDAEFEEIDGVQQDAEHDW